MPIQIPFPHLHHNHHHHHHRLHHRHAEEQGGSQFNPPQSQSYPDKFVSVSQSSTRKLICLFLKCIIMTFIIFLFSLFIGLAALLLFCFLILTAASSSSGHGRRRHPRQRQTHRNYYSFSEQSILYTLQDVENILPRISYAALGEWIDDCAICLENFEEDEFCRKLPDCNHLFHVDCVDNWLVKVPNCPVCRNPIRMYSGRVGPVYTEQHDWRVW